MDVEALGAIRFPGPGKDDACGTRSWGSAPEDFTRMLAERRGDTVVVTSVDRTHDRYIIGALEHGCDMVTEKPLTVDELLCQAILDAQARTGRRLTVSFNYRYAPRNAAVKELITSGAIGDVLSMAARHA